LSKKKPNEFAGKMEIKLDLANVRYKPLKLVVTSAETAGKTSPKSISEGKLVQKHLRQSESFSDVSRFDGQELLPMNRRNG
jgi:hypothetical protein